MSEHQIDEPLFDYKLYRFGRSKQIFRGPPPQLDGRYVAFIGGSGTFGRFADRPFADLVGEAAGVETLNLGSEGAGTGFFLMDPEVLGAASNADVVVVQVMAASAMSNRMFSVRPRRNARLQGVSELLAGIYPEVDFDSFSYAAAMLRHLSRIGDDRFRIVANEMRNAWIARNHTLLAAIQAPTILFWFAQRLPEEQRDDPTDAWHYPNFVDRGMVDSLSQSADGYVECVSSAGMPQDLTVDGQAVLFRPSGTPIDRNRDFPSPQMHEAAAAALLPEITRILQG